MKSRDDIGTVKGDIFFLWKTDYAGIGLHRVRVPISRY
jgi:hypothetical protein